LVINSTLLQASAVVANWRSVIPYLLELRSPVARLPSCLCGKWCSSSRRRNTALAGTYDHRWVPVRTGYKAVQVDPGKTG